MTNIKNEDVEQYLEDVKDLEVPTILTPEDTIYTFGEGGDDIGSIPCKNTYKLQMTALHLFASNLGYEYKMFAETDGDSFIDIGRMKSPMEMVSSKTMVKLYNSDCNLRKGDWHGDSIQERADVLGLEVGQLVAAINSKLVKNVFLQVTKYKRIQVQRHLVQFA